MASRKEYTTPANFLRGATAAALLTGVLSSAREAGAQAPWPVWSGQHPLTVDAPNKLAVYSERPGEDVVATVWNMKDPCTVSIIVAPSGGKRVDINGPVAGNAYVVRNETVLAQRVRSMQDNTLKGREDLAACPPEQRAAQLYWLGANVPAGFSGDAPSWVNQVSAPVAETTATASASESSKPAVWTKFEATGEEKDGPAKIGHDQHLTVAEVWDGKDVNSFRLVLVNTGHQLSNTDWKGGGWYVEGGNRDQIVARVAEMAKEQTALKGRPVNAYYVGDGEAPDGLTKLEGQKSQTAQVAPAVKAPETRTVENGMDKLPLKTEFRTVAEQFIAPKGNVPEKLDTVTTDAYSMVLQENRTYLLISQSFESKSLNSKLPQKADRTHFMLLRGNGQMVAFTNITPGQFWVGSVEGLFDAAYVDERAQEAYGTQTTLTFRKESAPAVSASFTVNESEESVWNPFMGSWVVETGNTNYDAQTAQAPSTEAAKAQEGLQNVRSYDISREKPADKQNYTLVVGWNGEDPGSTRVAVVEPGTTVETWELKQGTAWVVSGSRDAALKRAVEMADEVAKSSGRERKKPVHVGAGTTDPNQFDSAPGHWTVKR